MTKCCDHDHNEDGNCHIHSAPGVSRLEEFRELYVYRVDEAGGESAWIAATNPEAAIKIANEFLGEAEEGYPHEAIQLDPDKTLSIYNEDTGQRDTKTIGFLACSVY